MSVQTLSLIYKNSKLYIIKFYSIGPFVEMKVHIRAENVLVLVEMKKVFVVEVLFAAFTFFAFAKENCE